MDERTVLKVRNLAVSFRTDAGRVQAVRGVSFDLYKGETLALVGESGSGKSVTCRAVMGILAANARKEGGEILFDGRDLLKISDGDFDSIRGDKIAMIFQDPTSSLNPIMRVGKQLTEAMLIKSRSRRRQSVRNFKSTLALVCKNVNGPPVKAERGRSGLCRRAAAALRKPSEPDHGLMAEFYEAVRRAAEHSHEKSREYKRAAVAVIDKNLAAFGRERLKKSEINAAARRIIKAAERAADRLAEVGDNSASNFSAWLKESVRDYFVRLKRGGAPDGAKAAITSRIMRFRDKLESDGNGENLPDFDERALEIVKYLEKTARGAREKLRRKEARDRAIELLEEVGINDAKRRFKQYPFEFSGGMRQRIVIAIALSADPEILICDEPTTALDVSVQAQILELIERVKERRGLSVIFITHDLGVVANVADRVAVMYAGKIAEIGTVNDIFYAPAHPYTWALLSSAPDGGSKDRLEAIPGTPPNMINPPAGDAFAARNRYAMKIDFERQPPLFRLSQTHFAATWLAHPKAPKVEPPKSVKERIAASNAGRGEVEDANS